MISVFWGTLAYILFPTACLSLFLMLSSIKCLEKLGCSVCCADVQIGSYMKCNVLVFCVLLSCIGFLQSHFGVEKYEKLRNDGSNSSTVTFKDVSMDDRYKLQLFRDQRNWWISLCNLVLWLTCWRVQALMRSVHASEDESGGGRWSSFFGGGGSGPSGKDRKGNDDGKGPKGDGKDNDSSTSTRLSKNLKNDGIEMTSKSGSGLSSSPGKTKGESELRERRKDK